MRKEIIDFDVEIDRTEVPTLKFDPKIIGSIFGKNNIWPSWVADMDFKGSSHIKNAIVRRAEHGVYGYEPSSDELTTAVSAWHEKRHNWSFKNEQVIFSPRTLASIASLIRLFSKEGEGVIVQPPVFYDFKRIILTNKRLLVKNPLKLIHRIYQIDFEHLEMIAADPNNKLLILCNPHNPIGRVWSSGELARISEICIANDVYIITDEIHGDITYQSKYTPLASINKESSLNCASCISPVKSFNLAGVANSMIVISHDEKRLACQSWFNRMQVNKNNVFTSAAMLAAYTKGESWLGQVIEYLEQNIKMLKNFLQEKIPLVKLIEPEGTYLLWLDFRNLSFDVKQLEDFLVQQAGIAGNPGHWFGREGAGFARINIACPRRILKNSLEKLETAVRKLSNCK